MNRQVGASVFVADVVVREMGDVADLAGVVDMCERSIDRAAPHGPVEVIWNPAPPFGTRVSVVAEWKEPVQ